MAYSKIRQPKLSDVIEQQLEFLILEGTLRPGEKLPPERELAKQFDVSRPSLREAIQRLEAKGLLLRRQGGGTFVQSSLWQSFSDPLVRLKYFGAGAVSHIDLTDLLLGNQIGGLGASQAGALFIGGSYLAARGTIRWEIALSFFVGVFLTAALYNVIDAERFATPFFHLCTGSTFLGGFFLATEWASSPGRQIPMMLYGLIGGAMVIIIRVYGIYPDGVPFAILLINLLAPLLDSIHPKPFGAR